MKKVFLFLLIFVLQTSCFKVVAQDKNDLSSSLMLLYSPLDGSGKVLSETTSIGKITNYFKNLKKKPLNKQPNGNHVLTL